MTDRHIKKLFKRMTALWGRKFVTLHGVSDTNRAWLNALKDLPPQAISIGLERCERAIRIKTQKGEESWPPSEIEFRAMCCPSEEDFGLPTDIQAYRLAINCDWSSHPIVYLAAKKVGTYELRTQSQERTEKKFCRAYAELVDRVLNGEIFTLPAHVGPDRALPEKVSMTPEQRRESIQRGLDHLREFREREGV
ncbi:MAG: hypothetical protein OEZ19_10125 [Paracoccaceae bacterium]|nr:hypothetical protein [Paracoccaceae bacterium]